MLDAFAYARNPALLFQPPACGFPPPLNFESLLFNGKQPVRYEKKHLLRPIENFKQAGEIVEIVDIDWINGRVIAYYNAEEALNGIPAFTMDNFRIKCPPETVHDYITETVAFLRRGHSLLHPLCTCAHGLSKNRCQTLGISSMYSDFNRRRQEIPCVLSSRPREFSNREVSDELGISDVILFSAEGSPLLHTLNRHCTIRMDGMRLFFSCKEFVFHPLDNREDLLRILSRNPLTISVAKDQYQGILNDIHEMVASGMICILPQGDSESKRGEEQSVLMFYMNPRWNIGSVDQDIRALWHAIRGRDISQELSTAASVISTSSLDHPATTKKRERRVTPTTTKTQARKKKRRVLIFKRQ